MEQKIREAHNLGQGESVTDIHFVGLLEVVQADDVIVHGAHLDAAHERGQVQWGAAARHREKHNKRRVQHRTTSCREQGPVELGAHCRPCAS